MLANTIRYKSKERKRMKMQRQ